MEDNLPPAVGLTQAAQTAPAGTAGTAGPAAEPPMIDVQDVMDAAETAHHRIRRAVHAINAKSHQAVDFLAHHQGSPDIARLEREREQVHLQMYRNSGMR